MNIEKKCIECAAALLCATGLEMMVGACVNCGEPLRVSVWSWNHTSAPSARWLQKNVEDYPFEVLDDIVYCGERASGITLCRMYEVPASGCSKCDRDKEMEQP